MRYYKERDPHHIVSYDPTFTQPTWSDLVHYYVFAAGGAPRGLACHGFQRTWMAMTDSCGNPLRNPQILYARDTAGAKVK